MEMLDSLQRGHILAALAVGLILLAIYLLLYRRAWQPQTGTLEWIGMYDRPRFSMCGQIRFGKAWIGSAVLAIVAGALRHCMETGTWSPLGGSRTYYIQLAFICLGAAAMVLLTQALLQSQPVSLCAGILYGLVAKPPAPCAFLVLSLLCLWCYLRLAHDAAFWRSGLLLTGAIGGLLMGAVFDKYLLWLAPLYWLCHVAKLIGRAKYHSATEKRVTATWPSLLVALLLWGIGAILLWTAVSVRNGMFALSQAPSMLIRGDYYREIWLGMFHLAGDLLQTRTDSRLYSLLTVWPVALIGIGSLVGVVAGMVRRHDSLAVAVLVLATWLLLPWFLNGKAFLTVGLLLSMGYVWRGFWLRKWTAMVWICMVLCLLAQIVIWIYIV